MPVAGFETTIPASERAHNHALHSATTETGWMYLAKESFDSALGTEIMSLSHSPFTLLN
jgi:hypothetical protein